MRFLKKIGIIIPFFSIFLMSQNACALSPSYTEPNYIWRTPNSSTRWFLQNQGRVTLKNYLYSGIGRQFIGRYQFSFPTNISNLSEYTVLYLEFQLKTNDYSDVNPGGLFPYTGWGQGEEIRLNLNNQSEGYCNIKEKKLDTITYYCQYVFNNVGNISQLWLDLGDLSIENDDHPYGNKYLYVGSTFWIEYINYSFTTGLSPSSQAIINAINASNSQVINQNQTIIENNQQYYDANYQAVDNIENQNSNYPDATNQQTANLISILSGFIGQITNFQATTCELNMPFPSFFGGDTLVNICQGKDVLGSSIGVIASFALIAFTIPLVIKLINMIYYEIRSFTDG